MDAIHYLSAVAKEPARFVTILQQMLEPGCSLEFKKAGMRLIANVINFAPVRVCISHLPTNKISFACRI